MAELPVELIIEILQRLPVKTLLRLKCVCKSIRETIESPNFIKSHLNTTSDNNKKLIVREVFPPRSPEYNPITPKFLVFNIDDPFRQLFYMPDEFATELRHLDSYSFYAHCDGLVVLGEDLYNLGVWNSSTRKYKRLPPLLQKKTAKTGGIIGSAGFKGLGFGYDSSSADYKILLMEKLKSSPESQMWIWILGLRSCHWKKIETFPYIDEYRIKYNNFRYGISNCFVDGAFHFLCKDDTILTFDVAKETFSRIPLPNLGQTELYTYDLQVFEGCLCVHFKSLSFYGPQLYLIRKKDGVKFSWTKLFPITEPRTYYRLWEFLGYSKEGDKVFVLDNENSPLYSFDNDFKSSHWNIRFANDSHNLNIIFCNESLVPVDYQKKKKRKRKAY